MGTAESEKQQEAKLQPESSALLADLEQHLKPGAWWRIKCVEPRPWCVEVVRRESGLVIFRYEEGFDRASSIQWFLERYEPEDPGQDPALHEDRFQASPLGAKPTAGRLA
ncbi:hypothetical protein [Hyalangium minutum]|uniref:hypothetical protein n=1 Tax=Hyalangium minutum TaxID=394096 RepID=UPI0005C76FC9|nr:hypothetical protein [Hyalangium minutum]